MKKTLLCSFGMLFILSCFCQQKSADIQSYGAKGDGVTDNTLPIQRAIDEVNAKGAGRVVIPAGRFVTGVLHLKSNVELHLAAGARLMGSAKRVDYGAGAASALIVADGQQNIAITGKGIIDGQALKLLKDIYRMLNEGSLEDPEWKTYNPWHQMRPSEKNRPKIIEFRNCDGVRVKGVTIRDGLCWIQNYKDCSNITIDSIKVISTTFWNNDGIDLVDCKKVRVTNCFINAADDGICLKSENAQSRCEDIYIAHCSIRSSASAFKLGTASRGGFSKITVKDLYIYDTYRSAIALESVDGAILEDIDIRKIRAVNTGNAICLRLGRRNRQAPAGELRHVYIGDMKVGVPAGKPDKGYEMEGPPVKTPHNVFPSSITGLPGHPVQDITLENIEINYAGGASKKIAFISPDSLSKVPEQESAYPEFSMFGELPASGLYVRHAEGIHLKNVRLRFKKDDFRPAIIFDDVKELETSYALIRRLLPERASSFIIEPLQEDTDNIEPLKGDAGNIGSSKGDPGNDVFELESRGDRIILRGNNGVAIASGLYYYLENYCHCQVTWNGSNLRLPAKLPIVEGKIRKKSPYNYRYYLNYCTFNYSMSWWDWPRWEKEIDWMALHGINMPLAITGEEYTWYSVYKEMGFTEEELASFFSGPAYFAWFWMGNLDGWGGPLSLQWMESHRDLQTKILQRERELGMKPVLPAFTGHVPASFKNHFPSAILKQTNWNNGFADTYILDSGDPLFAEIGKKFLDRQTRLFGTDHYYSADTFNENEPPSDDSAYLAGLSRRLYEGMRQADTTAIWVMQGWLFYSDRKFWKAPQIKALLDAVPDNHMLLLDLAAEIEPVWKRTAAFYGKPWIWNMLNNFGGNVNLFGRMDGVASGPALALNDNASGRMAGIGLTMEAIEQNPVIYELMMAHAWQSSPVVVKEWLGKYIRNRYGVSTVSGSGPGSAGGQLLRAWDIIRQTVYNGRDIRDGAESIITGRPTFDSTTVWTRTKLNYPPQDLLPAWDLFIRASGGQTSSGDPSLSRNTATEGFLFDLTDITRQVLANYALPLQRQWVNAFLAKDSAGFRKYSRQFIELIEDMDGLLSTRRDFLLGPWIAAARSWGTTPDEQHRYEMNARDLITLWGDANSPLHEYANRQWSGLLNDFYKVRWQKFFTMLDQCLDKGTEPDFAGFEKDIRQWEWAWVNEEKSFPTAPSGNSVESARALYHKYRQRIQDCY